MVVRGLEQRQGASKSFGERGPTGGSGAGMGGHDWTEEGSQVGRRAQYRLPELCVLTGL